MEFYLIEETLTLDTYHDDAIHLQTCDEIVFDKGVQYEEVKQKDGWLDDLYMARQVRHIEDGDREPEEDVQRKPRKKRVAKKKPAAKATEIDELKKIAEELNEV